MIFHRGLFIYICCEKLFPTSISAFTWESWYRFGIIRSISLKACISVIHVNCSPSVYEQCCFSEFSQLYEIKNLARASPLAPGPFQQKDSTLLKAFRGLMEAIVHQIFIKTGPCRSVCDSKENNTKNSPYFAMFLHLSTEPYEAVNIIFTHVVMLRLSPASFTLSCLHT